MCNFLHEPVTKIKPEGIAYKLFTKYGRPGYKPLVKWGYSLAKGKSISWSDKKANIGFSGNGGDGFCMIMDKQSARKAARLGWWNDIAVVCKIKYRGGLGKFREDGFWGKITTIALCKEFEIVEEIA